MKMQPSRMLLVLMTLVLMPVLPVSLHAQGGDALTLVALDPARGELVPVGLDLARRWEVRLDPATGAAIGIGAGQVGVGPAPLLAIDPSTRMLLAVDLVAVPLPGRIDVDARTGASSSEGFERRPPGLPPGSPILVGFDPGSGTLAPIELGLRRQAGTFILEPRVGTLSPPPEGPAMMGYDLAAESVVPTEITVARGRGELRIDPATGQVSFDPAAPAPVGGSPGLLAVGPDGGTLVPVELEVVYRQGLLTMDPATGGLSFPADQAAEGLPRLTLIGVSSPTGALMRADFQPALRPGAYTIDLLAGTVEPAEQAVEQEPERGTGFVFGAGLDLRQMLKLEDVLEEGGVGGTGASATGMAPGIHGFAEYQWRFVSVGVEVGYSVMDTEIRFPQGPQTGDLQYLEYGGNLKLFLPLESAFSPYATFTILRVTSSGDFELEGLTENRDYEAKRDGIGLGFDYWATPAWGFRFEGLYNTTFEDSDAAEHIRWRLGVTFSPERISPLPPVRVPGRGGRL